MKLTALSCTALLLLAGCASTPPRDHGTSGGRIDATRDHASEANVQTPRSADLINATDQMAQSLAARADINDPDRPTTIYVGTIENRTSTMRGQNFDVFLARLRANLNDSGARHGIRFVRERQFVEEQRDREYGGKDPASTAERYQSRADYVLTAVLYDLPSGGTNYFSLDVQVVQLREATGGSDRGAGGLAWEEYYEVKFQ